MCPGVSPGRRDFAYFTASLGLRFPPSMLSLIRSFARHPALLTRQTKMAAPTRRNFMALRQFGAVAAMPAALALATPAYAVTELQWWHAMTGGNNDIVNKLAEEFNASQPDYKVIPSFKGSYPDTMNAGIAAFRAGNAPHIIQLFEVATATRASPPGRRRPLYQPVKYGNKSLDP